MNGSCNFIFKVHHTVGTGSPPGGGILVGTEIKQDVQVKQGLFKVPLDFTEGAFNRQARWLEIAVDCGTCLTTLSPRQAVTASPHAVRSMKNQTVDVGARIGAA